MKKITANAPLCVLVCKTAAYKQHANSNLQLTVEKVVYPLEQQDTSNVAKKSQKTFKIKFTQKKVQ